MSKFSKGDTVLCVSGNIVASDCQDSRIYNGDEYIIQRVHGTHTVKLQGVRGSFNVDRFTLIQGA